MIVNIRGTHGSGKSTVATLIMKKYGATPVYGANKKRPEAYRVELPGNRPALYIVGPYETACGGCDAVQPYSLIWPQVTKFHELGNVLFEGALISTTYGSIGAAANELGEDFVFAFMDTPLEVCIKRVNKRRAAKGVGALEDTGNISSKWTTIRRLHDKLLDGTLPIGNRVAAINHLKPVTGVMALFGVRITKEPT